MSSRDPGSDLDRAPGQQRDRAPGSDLDRDSGRQPDRAPGRQPDRAPGRQPDRDPGSDLDRAPGRQPDRDPGSDLDRAPGRQPDRDPGRQPDRAPGRQPDRDPGRQRDRAPGRQPGCQPGPPPTRPRRPAQRLFAAILPPPSAVAELRAAVAPLRTLSGARDLRWTRPEDWHVTLAFYGEVPDEDVRPELEARLGRAAHRTEPFCLRVHGAGHFGGRALWAGAAGGLDALRLLAERADAAGRRSGVPLEEHRRFTPHLTLARSRARAELRPFTEALAGFEGQGWEAGELSLVRSELPHSGVPGERPRYAVVRAWALGR